MLALQKYLTAHGLAKTLEDFKLKAREYDNKVLIKYDQIESDMNLEEVQDARGIILEKGTWKVMALSFRKFFNSAEGKAASIDWSTARILEKLDGSLIQCYYDWHKQEWFGSTTGTGEGEGEVNNKLGTTFNQLFWQTLVKTDFNVDRLDTKFTFVFELTTPYNIVVKPHGESTVTLLTARNIETLEEIPYGELVDVAGVLDVPVVKSFDLNPSNSDDLIKSLEGMPWSEEGYVVVDANFNRVKIKNPAYVAVHHLKSKTAEHNILTIVKTNEIEEFAATFPERADELLKLKFNYDNLLLKLNVAWGLLEPFKPVDKDDAVGKKAFAMETFKICSEMDIKMFSGLFFALSLGKVANVKEYMLEYDDKVLYKIL